VLSESDKLACGRLAPQNISIWLEPSLFRMGEHQITGTSPHMLPPSNCRGTALDVGGSAADSTTRFTTVPDVMCTAR
jgi:hypothetical protein